MIYLSFIHAGLDAGEAFNPAVLIDVDKRKKKKREKKRSLLSVAKEGSKGHPSKAEIFHIAAALLHPTPQAKNYDLTHTHAKQRLHRNLDLYTCQARVGYSIPLLGKKVKYRAGTFISTGC